MKSIYNKSAANKIQNSITALQKKLSFTFGQSTHKGRDNLLGQFALDTLTSPLFGAIFGAGVWNVIDMVQQALTTWDEERRPTPAPTPHESFNKNALWRLEGWLEHLIHEWANMEEADKHPAPALG